MLEYWSNGGIGLSQSQLTKVSGYNLQLLCFSFLTPDTQDTEIWCLEYGPNIVLQEDTDFSLSFTNNLGSIVDQRYNTGGL